MQSHRPGAFILPSVWRWYDGVMPKTTIDLPPDVHEEIKSLAVAERRSMRRQVRVLLEEALAARRSAAHRRDANIVFPGGVTEDGPVATLTLDQFAKLVAHNTGEREVTLEDAEARLIAGMGGI